MEISPVFGEHPDESVWEEYVFGRLNEEEEAATEEHLLVCDLCRNKLAEVDEFVRLMKFAATHAAKNRTLLTALRPALVASGVATACLLAAGLIGVPNPPAASVFVPLKSTRGGIEAAFNHAQAKHPLDLFIETAEASPSGHYRLEVMNATGEPVWSGAVSAKAGSLTVHMPKMLRPGLYWVRWYEQPSELLAEYGLKVE